MFSVNALFYGSHADLARRLLDSFHTHGDLAYVEEFRFGLNDVCDETKQVVFSFAEQHGVPALIFEPERNVGKYPLMAQMFHAGGGITATRTMWFDDDTFLNGRRNDVFGRTHGMLDGSHMLGRIYTKQFEGGQAAWLKSRDWYTGVPWHKAKGKPAFRFATGGWWAIRTEILKRWAWPDPEIQHNGGDTALGELIRQQKLTLSAYSDGLWINAGPNGGHSNAVRRGLSQPPVGRAPSTSNYEHYRFKIQVHTI